MHLKISRTHAEPEAEVRDRLGRMEERLRTKYGAQTRWLDDTTMSIGAPGVRGQLTVQPGELAVDLDLSVVLTPLRGRIERELAKELDSVLHA